MFLLVLAIAIGLFSSSWISLISTTLGLAILATGFTLAIAGETATPSAIGLAFLTAWGGATAVSGIAYLFKRLFISGRRRRKPKVRPPVEQTFD